MTLAAIFEYIAETGSTTYIKEVEQFNSLGVSLSCSKKNLFKKIKWQRKKFDAKGRLVEIMTTHQFLMPNLTGED